MSKSAGRQVPLRTCLVCRNKTSKGELLRIVATHDGSVRVDPLGKQAGRGAYVCKSSNCDPRGLKRDRLANALRTTVSESDWQALVDYRLAVVAG